MAMTRPRNYARRLRRIFEIIFDLMEPERPKVDRSVFDAIKGHVFDPADFGVRADGVCRLNPEMARMVVAGVRG
jgi:CRISP-associated protein Cas1